MTATDKVYVEILADVKNAVKGMMDVQAAVNMAWGAFKKVYNVLADLYNEYAKSQKIQMQLANAFRIQGDLTNTTVRNFEKLSRQLQGVTEYEDDLTMQSAAMIKQLTTLNEQAILKLIPNVQDFASAMNMDLVSAATLVAKTIGSDVDALSRYGISVGKAHGESERLAIITEQLTKKFSGMATTAGGSAAGQISRLANEFKQLKENAGEMISPIAGGVVTTGIAGAGVINAWYDVLKEKLTILSDALKISNYNFNVHADVLATVAGKYEDVGKGMVNALSSVEKINQTLKSMREGMGENTRRFEAIAELDEMISNILGPEDISVMQVTREKQLLDLKLAMEELTKTSGQSAYSVQTYQRAIAALESTLWSAIVPEAKGRMIKAFNRGTTPINDANITGGRGTFFKGNAASPINWAPAEQEAAAYAEELIKIDTTYQDIVSSGLLSVGESIGESFARGANGVQLMVQAMGDLVAKLLEVEAQKLLISGVAKLFASGGILGWGDIAGGLGLAATAGLVRGIPRMAEGGMVTRPTLAMIGENGPETVVPLGKGGGRQTIVNVYVAGNVWAEKGLARAIAAEMGRW